MQTKFEADRADLRRPDELLVGNLHRIERPIELVAPEGEELHQGRKIGSDVVILPDVSLEEPRMVRQAVEDFRRRQTISRQLADEGGGNAARLCYRAFVHLTSSEKATSIRHLRCGKG